MLGERVVPRGCASSPHVGARRGGRPHAAAGLRRLRLVAHATNRDSAVVRSSLSKRRPLPHSGPASGLVASRNCFCAQCRSFSPPSGRNSASAISTRLMTPSVCTASSKYCSAFRHAVLACCATPRASQPRCLLCATLQSASVALAHCRSARFHLPCTTRWSARWV
jgi:hypothetical protein